MKKRAEAHYTKCDNAEYFKSMAGQVDRARDLHSRYRVAYRVLKMYFDVHPEYTYRAEALAAWCSQEWAPWGGGGNTESWLVLKKSIDDEIVEVFGPGATLFETWRRWQHDQTNYNFIDFRSTDSARRRRDTDVDPADGE